MSPKARDRQGRTVDVNDSDLQHLICSDCHREGTLDTLRVASFSPDIPPAGRADWVCATRCITRRR